MWIWPRISIIIFLVPIVSAMLSTSRKDNSQINIIGVPEEFTCRDDKFSAIIINSLGIKACGCYKNILLNKKNSLCCLKHADRCPTKYRARLFTHVDMQHLMISINKKPEDGEYFHKYFFVVISIWLVGPATSFGLATDTYVCLQNYSPPFMLGMLWMMYAISRA